MEATRWDSSVFKKRKEKLVCVYCGNPGQFLMPGRVLCTHRPAPAQRTLGSIRGGRVIVARGTGSSLPSPLCTLCPAPWQLFLNLFF